MADGERLDGQAGLGEGPWVDLLAGSEGTLAVITAATLLGPLPEIDVITVSIAELKPMTLELSAPVAAALPEVSRRVRTLVG